MEAPLKDFEIKTKYGTYSRSAKVEGNKIIYKRIREGFAGRFPVSEQKEIIRFLDDVYKADRGGLVLVKSEP